MEKKLTRRSFFGMAAGLVALVPAVMSITKSVAADACPSQGPKGKALGSPTEGMGKSLEYVLDAKTSKNPKHTPGSQCGSCKFFNAGKAEGGYAPCTMMGMKYVSNCGWCKSYALKK